MRAGNGILPGVVQDLIDHLFEQKPITAYYGQIVRYPER